MFCCKTPLNRVKRSSVFCNERLPLNTHYAITLIFIGHNLTLKFIQRAAEQKGLK